MTIFPRKFAHIVQRCWEPLGGKIGLSAVGILLAAGLTFSAVMSVQMVRTICTKPTAPETVVVLGCKVRGTRPSRMLIRRLEAAQAYLEENPDVLCITTGGQGAGEDVPEGQACGLADRARHCRGTHHCGGYVQRYAGKSGACGGNFAGAGAWGTGRHHHRRLSPVSGIAAGETCRTAIGKRVCQDEPSVCAYLLGAGVDGTVSASGAGAWLRKQLHKARMQSRQAGFMVRYIGNNAQTGMEGISCYSN